MIVSAQRPTADSPASKPKITILRPFYKWPKTEKPPGLPELNSDGEVEDELLVPHYDNGFYGMSTMTFSPVKCKSSAPIRGYTDAEIEAMKIRRPGPEKMTVVKEEQVESITDDEERINESEDSRAVVPKRVKIEQVEDSNAVEADENEKKIAEEETADTLALRAEIDSMIDQAVAGDHKSLCSLFEVDSATGDMLMRGLYASKPPKKKKRGPEDTLCPPTVRLSALLGNPEPTVFKPAKPPAAPSLFFSKDIDNIIKYNDKVQRQKKSREEANRKRRALTAARRAEALTRNQSQDFSGFQDMNK